MRTTVTLDDELYARAEVLSGAQGRAAVLDAALRALIERESARRLARLGGTEPELVSPPRRRPDAGTDAGLQPGETPPA